MNAPDDSKKTKAQLIAELRSLREREVRFRMVFDASVDAIGVSSGGVHVFMNRAYLQLFGYDAPEELTGKPVIDFIAPECRARIASKMRRRARGEPEAAHYETRGLRRDGSVFDMAVHVSIYRLEGIEYTLGILRDITEQKRAEKALRLSEARLRAIAENTPDHIHIQDRNLRYQHVVNPQLGFSEEEVLGKTDEELFGRRDAQKLKAIKRRVLETGQAAHVDVPLQNKRGETEYFEGAILPMHDASGQVDGIIGYFRNVTERKRTEVEMELYGEIAKNITQGIYLVKAPDLSILYANPKMEQMFGYGPGELTGKPVSVLSPPGMVDFEVTAKEIERSLAQKGTWRGEVQSVKKNGAVFWSDLSISRHKHPVYGLLHISLQTDIASQKRLEEQLRQAQKMEAIGQLAGGIAHDFNNIMQVVLGNIELLLRDYAIEGDPREMLEDVSAAAQRAADLTRQLLAFSRRQIIRPVHVNLNSLVRNVLRMARRLLGEHIEIFFIDTVPLDTVFVDEGQMEQVVLNLCLNARDAMPCGGLLMIRTENVTLNADFCRENPWATEGRYVLVRVKDTGVGMAPETLSHVFEPFFTTKGLGHGTGLGLATVYGILKQHNGLTDVASTPGEGSEFSVYLPVVEPSVQPAQAAPEVPATGGSETILVAEDEPAVLKMTAAMLRLGGYSVLTATNGHDALRVFKANADAVDLLLLDVIMPGIGGGEVMRRIREQHPAKRFLFSSGYSAEDIHEELAIRDSHTLVHKPYHGRSLLRAVRQVLDEPL